MLMGQMLGLAAQNQGLNATFFPTYGPQQRGGTSGCRVVISNDNIYSPIPNEVDIFVVMNQEAHDKYLHRAGNPESCWSTARKYR
jgi:2-oxoglutarate ferredoxin oxidoreductase subunit gamma